MRYFLDVEFNGFGGALISIALVPEDKAAAAFYGAVPCADPQPWIAAHVLPRLDCEPVPVEELAYRFATYLAADPQPVIVADWPEDIAHAARLLSDGPHRLLKRAVRFDLLPACGFSSELFSDVPHNAYHDAVGLRDWVQGREADGA